MYRVDPTLQFSGRRKQCGPFRPLCDPVRHLSLEISPGWPRPWGGWDLQGYPRAVLGGEDRWLEQRIPVGSVERATRLVEVVTGLGARVEAGGR